MQLAQFNVARMLAPLGSELMLEFEEKLDPVNQLAEQSPGFVWRFKEDNNNATSVTVFDDDCWLINMSVWQSIDDLFNYVYKSGHLQVFRKKQQWFEPPKEKNMVMWYIKDHMFPSIDEAVDRLLHLREHGDTPYAFSFKSRFTVEDLNSWNSK
jgi:hypothetical protein